VRKLKIRGLSVFFMRSVGPAEKPRVPRKAIEGASVTRDKRNEFLGSFLMILRSVQFFHIILHSYVTILCSKLLTTLKIQCRSAHRVAIFCGFCRFCILLDIKK